MIPSALCSQLEQGLADFLRMSFWSSTPGMEKVIDRLIKTEGAILKGPYVSLKLPFQPGAEGEFFPKVPLGFPAHLHQEKAFRRLSGKSPQSTLVATGTGSGKTEAFLWPILEHCRKNLGTPGIKAILIYPMNALATDQAGRIARAINGNKFLSGDGKQDGVRAGLYIGESQGEKRKNHKSMGADHVITDRKAMQDNPPDILLTNYKMLDYLLVRPKDQELWKQNIGGPLQYLVVDELHTFDGAQGTDLACLIRRLKDRLAMEANTLCCVGTSATLGGSDSIAALRSYAEDIFGENFGEGSVIAEERLSPADFTEEFLIEFTETLSDGEARLDPEAFANPHDYLVAQQELWFGRKIEGKAGTDEWRVKLGEQLLGHVLLRNVLGELEKQRKKKKPLTLAELAKEVFRATKQLRDDAELSRRVMVSFLSLVAEARSWQSENEEARLKREEAGGARRTRPFLEVRVQLWQRELRRMVADLGPEPTLRFSDDLTDEQRRQQLPVIHCRDCGAMGWAALVARDRPDRYRTSLDKFYRAFFGNDSQVQFLWPAQAVPSQGGAWKEALRFPLNWQSMHRVTDEEVNPDLVREVAVSESVYVHQGKEVLHKDCPFCGASGSLTLLGFRGATLTSVYIDQLFASNFNDDKKLLTFSDSVQDAAHRAGFFSARTWRFNLRVALQQVVRDSEGITLAELPDAFGKYWRSPRRLDDATFATTFLAPSMEWLEEYEELLETGKLPAEGFLLQAIHRRIAFEIYTEYGHQARIGRSLPRKECSTTYVSGERIDELVTMLHEQLRNEVGGLRELEQETLRRFVLGALHHLRERGGILHSELPDEFVEKGGKTHSFTRSLHLPSLGPNSRVPALLTDEKGQRRFDTLHHTSGAGSWYERWVDRCLQTEGTLLEPLAVWAVVLPALVKQDILEKRDGAKARVWGLRPGVLQLTAKTVRLSCETCGYWCVIAESEEGAWDVMPCVSGRCGGLMTLDTAKSDKYFGSLYNEGEVSRVFAAEHTGLLTRGKREEVETQFKSDGDDRKPWFPNLLSCTPTLEMGIDIGSLSTAILCSVPPTQARYLQRVGRAGRRDGNSMLLTIAEGKPHDQYFFAKPERMLDGEVATPGIFLNASAVLERQLTAFTLDRWIADLDDKDVIPANLGKVFEYLDDSGKGRFPHNWLDFVEGRQTQILERFFGLFEERISEETRTYLREYLLGNQGAEGSLRWKVDDLLQSERKQRNSLKNNALKAKKVFDELAASNAQNKDHEDELRKMGREKEALTRLVKAINKTQTLQFLTDQGLLPNYAFPESPIRLRSVIWRQKQKKSSGEKDAGKKKSGKGRYETKTYEYVRPAQSALSELAPENRFFAGGRQVQINQIDVASADLENWRFCNQCTYSDEIDSGDADKDCPNCHSSVWGEESQKRQLLKLNQVYANESDRDSRIKDDREGRQPKFYNQHMLMTFDSSELRGAWKLNSESLPFAFEYIRRATFREINFGEAADIGAKFSIAGREEIRKGFVICKHCGMVQAMNASKKKDAPPAKPEHALWCSARKQGPESKDFEAAVYLYREFSSEAIRLLLPLEDVSSAQQLNSFVAAFQLGLRDKYGGRVDHLNTLVYSEPEKDGVLQRQYLALYDTVPGGTGYLKDFTKDAAEGEQHPLFDILRRAVKRMVDCECYTDPDRGNGCYVCLFAYRNSRDMAETSSRSAVDLFDRILKEEKSLEKIEALSQVSIDGMMDSILEARFVGALSRICGNRRDVRVEKSTVRNKPGYRVSVDGVWWQVEPQVELGPSDGIDPVVSIDFVFRPGSGAGERKPIAVFLDGYKFHHKRIGHDMLQRMTLLSSGGYDVFSFDWYDVDAAFHNDVEDAPFLLTQEPATLKAYMTKLGEAKSVGVFDKPMLEVFLDSLISADAVAWDPIATIGIMSQLSKPGAIDLVAWKKDLAERCPAEVGQWFEQVEDDWLLLARPPTDECALGLWAAVPQEAVRDMTRLDDYRVIAWLDDSEERREDSKFKKTWRGWLHLFQYLRALPNAWFITSSGATATDYQALVASRLGAPPEEGAGPWHEVSQDVGPEFVSIVEALSERGLATPVVGIDLPDAKGHSCGLEGELVWEELKVAVVESAEEAERPVAADWQVFERSALMSDVTPLCTAVLAAGGNS